MYSANPDPCLHNGPSGSEFRSNADPDPDQKATEYGFNTNPDPQHCFLEGSASEQQNNLVFSLTL